MFSALMALITGGFAAYRQHNENQAAALKRKDEIEQGEDNASNLDEMSLKTRGWKDDFVLVVVFTPLLLSFIPDYAPTVKQGFEALEHIPQPYWFIVGAVVIDVLGMRAMFRYVLEYFAFKFKGRACM